MATTHDLTSSVELRAFLRCGVPIGSRNHLDTDRDGIRPMPRVRGSLRSHSRHRNSGPRDHGGNKPRRHGGNGSLQICLWWDCLRDERYIRIDNPEKAQAEQGLAVPTPSKVASICLQPTTSRDLPSCLQSFRHSQLDLSALSVHSLLTFRNSRSISRTQTTTRPAPPQAGLLLCVKAHTLTYQLGSVGKLCISCKQSSACTAGCTKLILGNRFPTEPRPIGFRHSYSFSAAKLLALLANAL